MKIIFFWVKFVSVDAKDSNCPSPEQIFRSTRINNQNSVKLNKSLKTSINIDLQVFRVEQNKKTLREKEDEKCGTL